MNNNSKGFFSNMFVAIIVTLFISMGLIIINTNLVKDKTIVLGAGNNP